MTVPLWFANVFAELAAYRDSERFVAAKILAPRLLQACLELLAVRFHVHDMGVAVRYLDTPFFEPLLEYGL